MTEDPAPYGNIRDVPPPLTHRLKFMERPDPVRPGVTRVLFQVDTHHQPNWWCRFWQRWLLDIKWERL